MTGQPLATCDSATHHSPLATRQLATRHSPLPHHAFDQSSITEVKPPVWDGSALHLEWTSTAPCGHCLSGLRGAGA